MPNPRKADAATYDADKQYRVVLLDRVSLADHRLTLYPGKEYVLRGDLVNDLSGKVKSAKEV